MALHRLAYVSTSLLSDDPALKRREIADILISSRRNNESVQVTGALLATEHHFAQVLEGESAEVGETYARIRRDPRHKDAVVILSETIETRQFPEWSMAFIGPLQPAEQAVVRLAKKLPATRGGSEARALLSVMSRVLKAKAPAASEA